MIPTLQGALVDTVHMMLSISPFKDDIAYQNLGPGADPEGLISLSPADLVESVSEAVIAGKTSDLQPKLWVSGSDNDNSMNSLDELIDS